MRLFVYEFICGGGLAGQAAAVSLRAEGWAMLAAVLADFARLPGVAVHTLLEADFPAQPPGRGVRPVLPGEEETAFRAAARDADFTLVIAPEFDDLLATRCRWAEEESSRLLGPSPAAVRLTGDKLSLADHLARHGVLTPPTVPASSTTETSFPAVCKPRHGAGSGATFLVRSPDELPACIQQARAEDCRDELILQPFVPGQPASVAFLIGPAGILPLVPATQLLSDDSRFHYRGGVLPLPADRSERVVRIARRAAETVPSLHGYVGVDVVLGEVPDRDYVIEINPRLTTSYVGLRALCRDNLAEAMLRVVRGEPLPELAWRAGTVRFGVAAG